MSLDITTTYTNFHKDMPVLVINQPSMSQCEWIHKNCTSYEAIIDHDEIRSGYKTYTYARKSYVTLHTPEEQAMYILAWGDDQCHYTFRDSGQEFVTIW